MVMNETEMELFDVKFDDACSAFPHTERLHSHTTKQHKHALWRSPSRPLTMVKALVVVEETSFFSTEFTTYAAESMAKYREAMRVSWEDEGDLSPRSASLRRKFKRARTWKAVLTAFPPSVLGGIEDVYKECEEEEEERILVHVET